MILVIDTEDRTIEEGSLDLERSSFGQVIETLGDLKEIGREDADAAIATILRTFGPLEPFVDPIPGAPPTRAALELRDAEDGFLISRMIMGPDSDYVLTCGPNYGLTHTTQHANGTTVLTVKRLDGGAS